MDPDYNIIKFKEESTNSENNEVEITLAQIDEDFNRELAARESQLVEIQNRITCLTKTLHLLRYVLVSEYYNRNELQQQLFEPELKLVDEQIRLHPAVKKILNEDGSNSLNKLDFQKRNLRKNKKSPKVVAPIENLVATSKKELVETNVEKPNNEEMQAVPRNRPMVKKRIIVGNISKFMPSETRGDNSTHKWMIYVRGPKESPEIDDFISKIVFYLHPSYKPHDVIEVRDRPFHLSRRGWGEFPIRVQLYFVNPLNKPIDVIHNLKLDKSFTGRQTLGNETLVDLMIYDENAALSPTNGSADEPSEEPIFELNEENVNDEAVVKMECFEEIMETEIIVPNNNIDHDDFMTLNALTDHDYF